MEIKNWLNYEIWFNDTHEKIRFLLSLEKLVKNWKDAKMVDSFHVKHHHDLRVLRIRLLPLQSTSRNILLSGIQECLQNFGSDILRRSNEVVDENMSRLDYVAWKILEYNTEILFVLVNTYGADYMKYVKEKYWTGSFDMLHLLLNQLGLPEEENWKELANLELNSRTTLRKMGYVFK